MSRYDHASAVRTRRGGFTATSGPTQITAPVGMGRTRGATKKDRLKKKDVDDGAVIT